MADSRSQAGGWVQQADGTYLDAPVAEPEIATGPFDITDADWSEQPASGGSGGVTYHGRRRLLAGRWTALTSRRVVIIAIAVGALLVGTSVLVRALGSSPDPVVAPPPSPPQVEESPVDEELGRLGDGPPETAPPSGSSSPAATNPPVRADAFEAEAAELGSRGQVVSLDGASDGQAVKINGRSDGTFVRFGGVTVAEAGQYELTVFYFCDQDRDGFVSVNDGEPDGVSFPAAAEGSVDTVSLTVDLAAGGNTVTVGTFGGAPLFIDQITVTG